MNYSNEDVVEGPTTKITSAKMWAVHDNCYIACERAVDRLEAGQYTIMSTPDKGVFFSKKTVNLDEFIHLPDSASSTILKEIEVFWNKEDVYRSFGFLWKRGVLLWGPPGSGKTTTVQLLSKMIVDRDGLSIYIDNPKLGAYGLDLLRRIEPKRPVVVILEDIDAICSRYDESDLLSLLDGELQIDNVIFVATTNYPQKLDPRIVNRPSRFDIVKKIPMPSAEARRVFILNKNPDLADRVITYQDSDVQERIDTLASELEEVNEYLSNHTKGQLSSEVKRALKSSGEGSSDHSRALSELENYETHKAREKSLKKEIADLKKEVEKTVPEIDVWIKKTDGYSVAHIKELIIAVECFGRPLDEAAGRLTSMIRGKPNSADYGTPVGFDD